MDNKRPKSSEEAEFTCFQHITNDKTGVYVSQLREEWFYSAKNQYIFRVLKNNPDIDILKFRDITTTEKTEFISADETLAIFEPSDFSFESASSIIRQKYNQRLIDKRVSELHELIYNTSPKDWKMELDKFFLELETEEEVTKTILDHFKVDSGQLIDFGKERPKLENLLFKRKSYAVVGGITSHHKTNQLIDLLVRALKTNYPKDNKFTVLMFSGEEPAEDMSLRLFAKLLHINLRDIIKGKVRPEEITDLIKRDFPEFITNFIIVDSSQFKNASDVSRIIAQFNPDVWGIDFIQWFAKSSGKNPDDQNRNIMEAVATVKILVETTNSLAILLSQIRKQRSDAIYKFPRQEDLEWSGEISQYAAIIGLVFWPYKIRQTDIDKSWFCVSWVKVRYGDLDTEILDVIPEFCDFTYNPAKQNSHKEYLQM